MFGNRVEQDVTQSGTTTVTKFLYDAHGNAFADLNASNQVQFLRVFLNTPDGVIARIYSDGTEYWYLADHLGSVTGLQSNSGSLADTISYDAFGNPGESNPSIGDRYKFQGGEYDSTTGLSHFGYRYVSAQSGTWTSQDPLGLLVDSNPYRYVYNSPVNLTDPSGEIVPLAPIVIILAFGSILVAPPEVNPPPGQTPGRGNPFLGPLMLAGGAGAARAGIVVLTKVGPWLWRSATGIFWGFAPRTVVQTALRGKDLQIIQQAMQNTVGQTGWLNHISALGRAVEAIIPDGRVLERVVDGITCYVGASGVGIAVINGVTMVIRISGGRIQILGPFQQ